MWEDASGAAPPGKAPGPHPPEVITLAVRWYLRFGLSYRDAEELLAEQGVKVDHVSMYRCVHRFALEFAEAAQARPAAVRDMVVHANNPIETDHGRPKARLRPMRGLKRDRTARVIVAAHALFRTSAGASTTWEPTCHELPASSTRSPN